MFGPALPPGFQRRPKAAAPPPAVVSSPPVEPQVESDSDSDTDTYGPVQPISHEEAEALAMAQKLKDIDARANPASKEPDSALQKTLQREEWMLVPPEASRGPLEGRSYLSLTSCVYGLIGMFLAPQVALIN